jgi:branched-chain amino acid aminotransferase
MSGRVVFLNGRFVPESEARVSIFDSALVIGDMAFESTRTFLGEPFELRSHLERLFGTLEILEIDCGLSIEELEALTRETLDRNQGTEAPGVDWQIIHNISAGLADPFRMVFDVISPTVSINCWPLIPQLARIARLYESGVHLVIPEQRAMPPGLINPRAKTRSRVHAKLAQIQAHRIEPFSWPMLLDMEGYLAEGTSWNIFLIRGGRLLTPGTRNVLPGISRSITLKLAEDLGIPAEETDITPEEALRCDEMFCTATSFCVLPVRTLDRARLGSECPGPVTRQLMDAWRQHVGLDFVSQARQYAEGLADWLEKEKAALR